MFFECLTGRRPFPASDLLQALRAHIAAPRPLPSEHGADVPPALAGARYAVLLDPNGAVWCVSNPIPVILE